MGNKAEELYGVWETYGEGRGKEKLRKVGAVTQEDINGFLRLVKEREIQWVKWKLGYFVSLMLEECYPGRFIELDVKAVGGKIDVGYQLNWGGVLYVKGDVDGDVGWCMERGVIVVEGDVEEDVGCAMERGVVIVNGNVKGRVGRLSKEGIVVVNGVIKKEDWMEEFGEGVVVVNDFVYFGREAR